MPFMIFNPAIPIVSIPINDLSLFASTSISNQSVFQKSQTVVPTPFSLASFTKSPPTTRSIKPIPTDL